MESMPKVSVITTTYNRSALLKNSIESVLAQTFSDWELIILDDGSKDNTREVVLQYSAKFPQIRYVFQENQGLSKARHNAVSYCRGEYVAIVDDDDLYLPNKLERQTEYLDKHSDIDLVYSHVEIRDKGKIVIYPPNPATDFMGLIEECTIQTNSMLVRKKCFEKLGSFRPDLNGGDDYEMWMRISKDHKIAFLPGTVAIYERGEASMSRKIVQKFSESLIIYNNFLKQEISKNERYVLKKRCASVCYNNAVELSDLGDYRKSSQMYARAIGYDLFVGLWIPWSRFSNPVYRFFRPYAASLYYSWKELFARSKNSHGQKISDKRKSLNMESFKKKWREALLLPGETDLRSSLIRELREYFPALDPAVIEERFTKSEEIFAEQWKKANVDSNSEESLIQFYNTSEIEIFELMRYHSLGWSEGALDYVCALEIAQTQENKTYLDYGSGIGSAGILFAKAGFEVTLCDISSPLLNFAKWRFAKRGLKGNFIDLKQEQPSGPIDVITCFEVLEHVLDPLKTLRNIHSYLRNDGFLIATAPFGEDEDRPMHIVHDKDLSKKFRGQGFKIRWDMKAPWKGKVHEPFYIMQKAKRSKLQNAALEVFDYYIPDSLKASANQFVKLSERSLQRHEH